MAVNMWKAQAKYLTNFARICNSRISVGRLSSQADVKETEETWYPPVKPKFPPGKWNENMNPIRTWELYDYKQEILNLPTAPLRLQRIKDIYKKIGKRSYNFAPYSFIMPRRLEFNQSRTKTAMINSLPDVYSEINVDKEFDLIKPLVEELIISEHIYLKRHHYDVDVALKIGNRSFDKQTMADHFLKQLILTIMAGLSMDHPHLIHTQLGEKAVVEAQWDRYSKILKPEQITLHEHYGKNRLINKLLPFQGKSTFSFLLRSGQPLPEFVPRDHPLCTSAEYPADYHYLPTAVGMKTFDLPADFTAGCKVGDPCHFGLLGIVNTSRHIFGLREEGYGDAPDVMPQLRQCLASGSLFISTVAQAHYLGFNKYMDMPFPLTGQTIVTDCQNFSFFAYQLNTLELWLSDDKQPLRNLCWHAPEMKLYDSVEDGEIKGFNDETLKHIIKFFALAPQDRGYNMAPTLQEDKPDEYIPKLLVKKSTTKERVDVTRNRES